MLKQYGLRIGPAMGRYVLEQLARARTGSSVTLFPVIGGDARTGVPRRTIIPAQELLAADRTDMETPAPSPVQQGELFP
jgi:hypothetical protein